MPDFEKILSTFCASLSDSGFHRPMPEAKIIPDSSADAPSPETP